MTESHRTLSGDEGAGVRPPQDPLGTGVGNARVYLASGINVASALRWYALNPRGMDQNRDASDDARCSAVVLSYLREIARACLGDGYDEERIEFLLSEIVRLTGGVVEEATP